MMPKASLAPCMMEAFPQLPEGIVGIKNSLQLKHLPFSIVINDGLGNTKQSSFDIAAFEEILWGCCI